MLDKLIPPDDPRKVTNWRWFVAIAVALIAVNSIAGRIGMFGFGAYASAAELQEQSKKIDRLLTISLAQTIRDLRKEECRADGNKRTLQNTIEEYQEQYREITGQRYPLPPCENNDRGPD